MRGLKSIGMVLGVATTMWVAGVTTKAASPATLAPVSIEAPVETSVPSTPTLTDAQRRSAFNARLSEALSAGSGQRLADPKAPQTRRAVRPSRPTNAVVRADSPRAESPGAVTSPAVLASTREPMSTIMPPPVRTSAVRSIGRGYRAPSLDLRTAPVVPTNALDCLTQAIYYEARTESEDGQAAVAEVVLNRSRSGVYPADVCAVVYQRNSRTCQFTFTCDGSIGRGAVNATAWARAERIARSVYAGSSQALLPASSVNYHANYVRPSWGSRLARIRQIGAHIFYGAPLRSGTTPGASNAVVAPVRTLGLTFVRNAALDAAYASATAASVQVATSSPDAPRPN